MIAQELRNWQIEAKAAYFTRRKKPDHDGSTLFHATMGAGKTRLALDVAAQMLLDRTIRRVVVVTTSIELCDSWVRSAHKYNIQLESKWSLVKDEYKGPPSNFQGLAITYAKLCAPGTAEFLRGWCVNEPTFVILDEPHHLADVTATEASWGPLAKIAFAPTKERLLITGTPWRTEGTQIPFAKYDEAGFVVCDYRYSYTQALRDGVCRFCFFPAIEGSGRYGVDGEIQSFESLENTPESEVGRVLKTIYQPEGGWMGKTLRLAHKELMEMRANGHADAGALIVVSDTTEADRVVKTLRQLTRSEVLIATSKEDDAPEVIKRFREGIAPYLVAVQMVSEGVDIPRLRVGVYATSVRTRLAFRQFVGRFMRVIDGMEDQHAVIFIAWIEPFITFAREMEEEKLEALREDPKRPGGDGWDGPGVTHHTFNPLSSDGQEKEIIASRESFLPSEAEIAGVYAQEIGLSISGKQAALLIRRATGAPVGAAAPSQERVPSAEPDSNVRKDRRKEAARLQRRLAFVRSGDQASNAEFQAVGLEIKARFGVKIINANPEQLKLITEWLLREIHAGRQAI